MTTWEFRASFSFYVEKTSGKREDIVYALSYINIPLRDSRYTYMFCFLFIFVRLTLEKYSSGSVLNILRRISQFNSIFIKFSRSLIHSNIRMYRQPEIHDWHLGIIFRLLVTVTLPTALRI